MKATQLKEYAKFCIENNFNLLVKGKPGVGKTDVLISASKGAGRKVILSHPVVSDPTDFKGLPFAFTPKNGSTPKAEFLPFSDLRQLLEATEPITWFIDDLGQAPASVQAAIMQILLAREINGHKISDNVSIVAATNRKEDKAAVTGMLEPVKSRFTGGIIEFDIDSNDWVKWALNDGNMPLELISFIRFKPSMLENSVPTKDIINTASPRTISSVGKVQNAGLPQGFEHEAFKGIAGEAFAAEYTAFLKLMRDLPTLDEIILNPTGAKVPTGNGSGGQTYAICAGLANRASEVNVDNIITYLDRLKPEFSVACVKDISVRKPEVCNTKGFINWSVKHQELLNI
jgi:hypothetical protein